MALFCLTCRLDYDNFRKSDPDDIFYNEMKALGESLENIQERIKEIRTNCILIKTLKRISSSKEDL